MLIEIREEPLQLIIQEFISFPFKYFSFTK